MSTCISRHGEYGSHKPGDWCPRCGAFNEDAIVAERDQLRAALQALELLTDKRDTLLEAADFLAATIVSGGGSEGRQFAEGVKCGIQMSAEKLRHLAGSDD